MKVWYPAARDVEVFRQLREALAEVAEVVDEAPAECDILIEGRPGPDQLRKVRHGGAVIVPFAGIPPATLDALNARPDLSLHNLHHNGPETAETAMALLLAVSRRIVSADALFRRGDWSARYTPEECVRLEGKTALVLGMGSIGSRIAKACLGLGMEVIGVRRDAGRPSGETAIREATIKDMPDLLPHANALFIAIPETAATRGLLGAQELAALKPPSLLVNVARAAIVDERALFEALRDGVLHGAGLDVWYRYPKHPEGIVPGYFEMPDEARHTNPSVFPFHELPNVVMSPHRGGSSADSENARRDALTQLIREFAQTGSMSNRVNLEQGY